MSRDAFTKKYQWLFPLKNLHDIKTNEKNTLNL